MIRHLHPDLAHIPENEESILAWNARSFIPVERGWVWWSFAALLTIVAIGLGIYFHFWIVIPLAVVIFVFYVLHV